MQKTETYTKQLSMASRMWKMFCMIFLFFMAVLTVFTYLCDLYWNIHSTVMQFVFRRIGLTFVFLFFNILYIAYFGRIYKIKPYKEYSMWEVCKEYMHIKHILFWVLMIVNFQMVLIVDSIRRNQTTIFLHEYSYDWFVVSCTYHMVHYFYLYKTRLIDLTPDITTNPTMIGYLQCIPHAVKITSITLLLLFFLNLPLFNHSILSLLYYPITIHLLPVTITIFVLALLHRLSEAIYTRQLQADITVRECATHGRSFDIVSALSSISTSLSAHYFVRTVNDGLSDLQQDSLLYLAKEIDALQLSDKHQFANNWQVRYQALLARYQTAFTAIETNQFNHEHYPVLSNPQRLSYHLQLKWLNTLLRVCPQTALQAFVYQSPAFDTFNNAALSILVNTTLQNQLAVKRYNRDLPNARKKWADYLTVCNSDNRRVIYCIQAMNLLIRKLKMINLYFENVVFIWTLVVLSLWKSVKEQEQTIVNDRNQGVKDEDRSILLDVIDDYLYLVFNCDSINLHNFVVPQEFASVIEKYKN